MQAKVRLLISESDDPWFNLSVEDCIFNAMDPRQVVLFLWRNADTVVIGRAQNPWKECNLERMAADKVKLARRRSGGGAVFHDLGNSCFTFMAGKPGFDKQQSAQLVIDALALLGISAQASGRNDLVVMLPDGTRKISGSAYREKLDRGFYHGTLLREVDMTRLANYLNPDKKKLSMKGIESVRSRVMNLNEIATISHASFCHAITKVFFQHYAVEVEAEYISPSNLPALPGFVETFNLQSSWEWNFGNTPEFSHHLEQRFDWGGCDLHLDIKQATIVQAQLFTDALEPEPLEELLRLLLNCRYEEQAISAIADPFIQIPRQQAQLMEFKDWLLAEIR